MRRIARPEFTLIELLVVVAIIAILASMLLPVLGQARERARESLCVGNVRQITAAVQMYTEDFGGWHPPGYVRTGFTTQYDFLRAALVIPGYLPPPPSGPIYSYDSPSRGYGVFRCPSEYYQAKNTWGAPAGTWYGSMYGQNYYMGGQPAAGTWLHRRLDRLTRPAETYAIMDAASGKQVSYTPAYSNIRPRHGGATIDVNAPQSGIGSPEARLNVSYYDGHVEGIPYARLSMGTLSFPWSGGLGKGDCYCVGTYCSSYCNYNN